MMFMGNLKSSLINKNYEKATSTLEQLVDKDMTVHATTSLVGYMKSPVGLESPLLQRLLCQIEKKESTFVAR